MSFGPPAFSKPQQHPSLPARPQSSAPGSFKPAFSAAPTFANGAPGTTAFHAAGGTSSPGPSNFTAFRPGALGSNSQEWQASSTGVSAGPAAPSYFSTPSTAYPSNSYQQPQVPYAYQQQSYQPQQVPDAYAQPAPPQIRNPFAAPGQDLHGAGRGGAKDRFGNGGYDPETEAQIAQWQSAYMAKDDNSGSKGGTGSSSAGNANATALGTRPGPTAMPLTNAEVASAAKADTGVAAVVAGKDGKQKTVVRSGGGETWQDPTLLEWDPAHFRLFVGNLAGEVTDESLLKAFAKYESVVKARVIRDKRTTKSKGYGFVSFTNSDQFFKAVQEMQGKYIGSHPVILRRSTTEIKATTPADKSNKGKKGKGGKGNASGGGAGSGGSGGANTGAGVQKKQNKTKGGLKILG